MSKLPNVSPVWRDAPACSDWFMSPAWALRLHRSTSARGEGEQVVQAAFANAILMRPTVMFGADDAFLTPILKLLRRLPVYPMFGDGRTELQPVWVEDVAEAITRAMMPPALLPVTYECGGPRIYSYETLLRALAKEAGIRAVLLPFPTPQKPKECGTRSRSGSNVVLGVQASP